METQLVYPCGSGGNAEKALGIRIRETFETQGSVLGNFVLKVHGLLNTKTGALDYRGSLRKYLVGTGKARSAAAARAKLKLGPIINYNSRDDDIWVGLLARKHVQLPSADAWLKMVFSADLNTRTQQKEGNAHLRLSKAIYNFTDTQDLRLAVGYRATVDEKGAISGDYYGQLRENNWSLYTDFKGFVGARYDL